MARSQVKCAAAGLIGIMHRPWMKSLWPLTFMLDAT